MMGTSRPGFFGVGSNLLQIQTYSALSVNDSETASDSQATTSSRAWRSSAGVVLGFAAHAVIRSWSERRQSLSLHPPKGRAVHRQVVSGPEVGAIPAPGTRHVALLLQSRCLQQRQHGARNGGSGSSPVSRNRTERRGRARRVARHPCGRSSARRDSPRPTDEPSGRPSTSGASRSTRLLDDLLIEAPTRLEPARRLAVEDEGVAIVGDREPPESRDVERVADVGQAHQLRRPPDRGGRDHRQQHRDRAPDPTSAPADPSKRREHPAERRKISAQGRGRRHRHHPRWGPTGRFIRRIADQSLFRKHPEADRKARAPAPTIGRTPARPPIAAARPWQRRALRSAPAARFPCHRTGAHAPSLAIPPNFGGAQMASSNGTAVIPGVSPALRLLGPCRPSCRPGILPASS